MPINALVAVEGTPLGDRPRVAIWEMVRTIATARILFPAAMVRLSAGRVHMTEQDQALCFLAGANSIFAGEKLLTTGNPDYETDRAMFASDFPTDRLFATFDETMAALADAVADFSGDERRAMLAGNANRIYRLGLDLGGRDT